MTEMDRFIETVERYRKFAWNPRRILVSEASRERFQRQESFDDAPVVESEIDAVWFSRGSDSGREAWELRLIAENPFAFFETFEADESEEDREDVRMEMEARMRAHVNGSVEG